MTDQPVASQEAPAIADTSELSIDDARKMIEASSFDDEGNPVASADDATTEQQSAEKADAGPEKVPGETQEADPAEKPPVEPPRSWTKEAKDRWNTIPRDAQEEFARIEQ